MLVLVLTALFGAAFSAELDPSLTEWRLVTKDQERIKFPLRDYILEVKAFLPDEYDTNPPYAELFRTDKSTTMMMLLHAGGWKKSVGRLVWNTIKYDRGYDIAVEECDARYQAYQSFPAGGKKEQIWAWNFFEDHLELTCDGELQYEQNFDEGDVSPRKPGLPKSCRALGDADVDRITLKHMAGEYIRGRPKVAKEPEPTIPPKATTQPKVTTQPATTESPELPDDNKFAELYPTCDCWTSECNYCANMECTVQHDLIGDDLGIQVTSKLGWRIMNSIVLYDEEGNTLGMFQWSLKKILLTGCVSCQTPPAIRNIKPGTVDGWVFSLTMIDGVLTLHLSVDGFVVYENELVGECAERYKNVDRFAFFDMTCENTFTYVKEQMVAGARVTPNCAGSCPSS